ncbi:hypothetical protein [Pedobacter rhodius]|uniref:DUF4926 domain-containing protein n=1 Tax=Pedobacter rhodius TaxID=3004098 RepID=A0ABT4KU59_9SPHI|nr:hypothetical protein [Pedobacter sp. SJ11]MCZ4222465.1 hypothetical protein [Pedobacter sp. SJ11]
MMVIINENTPTSALLEIKKGVLIGNEKGASGTVEEVEIKDNDEFWLFIFHLKNGKQIDIRKVKNIC